MRILNNRNYFKRKNKLELFTSIFKESEFKDNKYRELQIQVLDSDIERIRIPVMEWVVDTLRIKTNIEVLEF